MELSKHTICPQWPISHFVSTMCEDKQVIAEASAVAILSTTKVAKVHFKHWLLQDWFTMLHTHPERYPQFILANKVAEMGDMLGVAPRLPVISGAIPSRELFFLPAQLIALTALCLKCHRIHLDIRRKKEAYDRQHPDRPWDPNSVDIPQGEALWVLWDTSWAALRKKPSNLVKVLPLLSRPVYSQLTASPRVNIEEIARYSAAQTSRLVNKLDLQAEHHELAMHYHLLLETLKQGEWAMWDALIRMPDHLRTLASEARSMIGRALTYWVERHAEGWGGLGPIAMLTLDLCVGRAAIYQSHLGKIASQVQAQGLTLKKSNVVDLIRPQAVEEASEEVDQRDQSTEKEGAPRMEPVEHRSRALTVGVTMLSLWACRKVGSWLMPKRALNKL